MDQQYDDTNRGAFFQPKPNNTFIGSGKLNVDGDAEYHVIIKATLPSGIVIREVYKKVGVLFENENQNPKAPHLSGDYGDKRLAVWFATSKAGQDYMDAKIGDKTPMQSSPPINDGPNDYQRAKDGVQPLGQIINNITEEPDLVDEIPF